MNATLSNLMRTIEELEKSIATKKREIWPYLYFGIVAIGIFSGGLNNPSSKVIFDLMSPWRYLSGISFGFAGLGLLYLVFIKKCLKKLVESNAIISTFVKFFVLIWCVGMLYHSATIFERVVRLKMIPESSIYFIEGKPTKFSIQNREISFLLDHRDYLIHCEYGCNLQYSGKLPKIIRVSMVKETDEVIKIEKIR